MNPELLMVFVPGISWILFSLGGTEISSKIPGQKWIRRWLLPTIYLMTAMCCVPWWQAILATLPAIAWFSMGYGDSIPWWQKVLIGVLYATIGAAIGISWWNLGTAIGFSVLFLLSNTKLTEKIFMWKICEGFFGLLVGIQLAYVLMGCGIIW